MLARRIQVLSNPFPVADANGLLTAVGREFAVEKRPRLLALAQERGREADTVQARRNRPRRIDQFHQGRQPILETGHALRRRARFNQAFPPDNRRNPDAAFVKRSFPATQPTGRLEEFTVRSAELVVERAIVRREDKNGVLLEAKSLDQRHDPADLTIHARDHGRIRRTRRVVRQIILPSAVRWVGPFSPVFGQRLFGHVQCKVRDGGGEIEEEGPLLVLLNESDGFTTVAAFADDFDIALLCELCANPAPRNRLVVIESHACFH